MLARLCKRGIEGTERDIIRTCLAGIHRQVAAGVTGYPDLLGWPQYRPRLARIAVGLAQVNAVRVEPLCEADAVIDDKGDIVVGADALQRLGKPREFVTVDVLHPQLECGNRAARQRSLQAIGEVAPDVLRADQV